MTRIRKIEVLKDWIRLTEIDAVALGELGCCMGLWVAGDGVV